MKRKIIAIYFSFLVILSSFCLIFEIVDTTKADQREVVGYIPCPGNASTGLAWDGQNIWVADSGNYEIYKINPVDGTILKYFSSPGWVPWGLTWDGQYLWHSDCDKNMIYKIDPSTGTIIDEFSGQGHPHGLAWDGGYLWNVDWDSRKIYKLNPTNGAVLKQISAPGRRGLTWDGRHLWCSSSENDKIYKINPSNGGIISSFASPDYCPYGLTWDGEYLWNADPKVDKIFKIKIIDIDRFASPGNEPMGLKFDGQYLWNADAETDKIYKIDPTDGEILGSVPSPGNNPTGLACDGQNIWVADSVDNLIYIVTPNGPTGLSSPGQLPWGLAWDGQYLWNADDHKDEIYKTELPYLEVVDSFPISWESPRGLTWDGQYLWNADAETDKIYKINPDTGVIIGSVNTPGNDPTGLTWDGQYLWNADAETDIIYRIEVDINENFPPSKPTKPSGPANLDVGETGVFVTKSTDPNGDKVYYLFDWDDDSDMEWVGPYNSGDEASQDHSWDAAGEYRIQVKAKDEYGAESKYSPTLLVKVEQKNNPNKPSKPSGPTTGKPREELTYSTSTTDPEGNKLYYMFEWGDGSDKEWIGPFNSGDKVEASHTFKEKDSYKIKVQAKDTEGYESEWSDSLVVSIAISKTSDYSFNKILENFPIIKWFLLFVENILQKNI
jgi:DNA-binding beta-propeller fold protein YncE